MPQNYELRIPNNGMNRDDEQRLVGENESRYILNLRSGSSEDDNVGGIENIKGTTQVDFDLPNGKNVCIGSYGDQTSHSNFFFIYNSLGNHTIFRYIPEDRTVRILVQESLLNFQEEALINDIDVVDNLLYWNDGVNPQRKINIDKADVDDPLHRQCFHYYLGDKYLEDFQTPQINIKIKDKRYSIGGFNGNILINMNQSLLDDKKELAKDVAAQFNAITSLGPTPINWIAEACGEYVKITITTSDYYSIRSLDGGGFATSQIIPQNHYQEYIERTIDVIKHPPHCNLTALIRSDETFERNFIKEKVFQFAARWIYDDNEKSVVSPYSPHIYNKYVCSQFTGDTISNYIELDLTKFPEIFQFNDLQTLKRLELFVRTIDQETGQQDDWKSITTLEQYQFIDIADTHYDFYNNAIPTPVDQESFVRPYHNVPILSKNQESVKNRIFYGNNLEEYDPVCLDADIDVEYDDVESRVKAPTHSVSGLLFIRAMFNGGKLGTTGGGGDARQRRHAKYQAIRKDGFAGVGLSLGGQAGDPTVWGGMSEGAGNDPEVWKMVEKTGQILPLDGFTVYLAGTDFYDITDQNIGDANRSNTGQNSKGVWQNTSSSDMIDLTNTIRDNLQTGAGSSGVGVTIAELTELITFQEEPTKVYSRFSIDNVPDGWYILRVASHTITQADLDDPNRGYQRTSTNVFQITNLDAQANPASVGYRESAIRGRNELLINVRGGNIGRIKIEIMDMSHASDFGSSKIATGYVTDNDIQNPSNTYAGILADTRIARAGVHFDLNPGDVNYNIFPASAYTSGRSALTDHNGYFYYGSIDGFNAELNLEQVRSHDAPANNYGIGQIQEKQGKTIGDIEEDEHEEYAVRVSPGTTGQNRVLVTGSIKDNVGLGIPKASVVSIRSEVALCDNDGDYQFWHYGILITGAGNPSLDTYLIPTRTSGSCSAFYDENQIYNFAFNYPSWWQGAAGYATYFNAPNQISSGGSFPLTLGIPFFTGDISNLATLNTMKRGWDGKFGIVYYDRGLRSGAVNHDDDLKLHIPFYTEKDFDDQIKVGIPILNWEVKHRPPAWATHWQWVRTRNETVGSYFQWGVKTVTYQDVDGNAQTYANATRMKLVIDNLVKYKDRYPTFDFEATPDNISWRVRFIKDSNENLFPEYVDLKILEYSSATAEIIVEKDFDLPQIFPGTTIELYDEKLDIETEIFYEFAECFEVGTDANGNKYHKGLAQDQDPINPVTTPATGTFRTGDAYYRLREIPDTTANNPAYIDDDAVSDFYKSEVESIGRVNGINPDFFQKWKPNQIRHGGKYIPDSNVNDLSRFVSDDFQPLPIEYGAINKLQLVANVLLSIHEFRVVSNYIEEGVVRKQDGTDDLVASTKVFDSFRAAKPITGTISPESVSEYRGRVYWIDLNKGLVNKYDSNGVSAISSFKMVDYFSDISKAILNNQERAVNKPRILGIIDTKRDEYIISFNNLYAQFGIQDDPVGDDPPTFRVTLGIEGGQVIDGGTNDTLYSAISQREENNIIFDKGSTPELSGVQVDNQRGSNGNLNVKVRESDGRLTTITRLAPGQGIKNFSLETNNFDVKNDTADTPGSASTNGEILVEGATLAFSEKFNKWTTFYSFRPEMFGDIDLEMLGFTDGKLWIHNDSDVRNKFYGVQYTSILETVFNSMPDQVKVFDAVGADSYYAWSVPSAKTPNGMETEVVAARFSRKEDSFHASMMRDKNDPRATSPQDGIINGRKLRDRTILVRFENTDTDEVVLFSVSMKSTISTRHGK